MANLAEKSRRTWRLLACSFQIIGLNKRLLLFPVLSFAFAVGIAVTFFLPALLYPTGQPWMDAQHWQTLWGRIGEAAQAQPSRLVDVLVYGYFGFFYLLLMVAATFWNVAFYHQINQALAGEKVSLGSGLRFALRRFRAILLWSLFAGAVGLIIRGLERRFGLVGRLILSSIGLAWSVAAVFVIPVMIREESANPLTLLKDSAATLKRTWGESLLGYVGFRLGESVIVFGLVLVLVAMGAAAFLLDFPALMVAALAGSLVALVAVSYVIGAAGHVYRCALYIYASEGVVPAPYSAELMDAAWKVK